MANNETRVKASPLSAQRLAGRSPSAAVADNRELPSISIPVSYQSVEWAILDPRFDSPRPVRLTRGRLLVGPIRPEATPKLPSALTPLPLRNLALGSSASSAELPSLRQALSERSREAHNDTWWNGETTKAAVARRLLPVRLIGGGVAAALVGAFAFQSFTLNGAELAAAPSEILAPERDNTAAFAEASRSFLRVSVATPSTAAPTTTIPPPTTTTTTAAPRRVAPTVPATTSSCSKSRSAARDCWWGLISQYDWNDEYAFNVMWCESTGNPNAKNSRSTATGLFQILNGPYDPEANVRLAHQMYSKRGWQPWVCKG